MSKVRCIRRTSACAAAVAIATALAGVGCGSSGSSSKAVVTSAAAVLFPVGAGDTWKYAATGDSGSGTATEKMTSVVQVTGGRKVMMTISDALTRTRARTTLVYFFHSDGRITSSGLPQARQRNVVTISSSSSVWWPPPAVIDSRRQVKVDVPTTLSGAERTYKTMAHITVQGMGTATVSVPAGAYRATVVSQRTTMSFFGLGSLTFITKTWLAPGVGPVQEQLTLINTAGSRHVVATLELDSFSKG